MILRRTAIALVALFSVAGSVACSGPKSADNKASTPTSSLIRPAGVDDATQVIRLKGGDSLKFDPAVIRVKPGRVRIVFVATGKQPQNFTALGLNANSGNVPAGTSATLELLVPKPGKYPFYNAYYQEQGMKGKIVATR